MTPVFSGFCKNKVEFINSQLKVRQFDSLEELAADMFINVDEMKEESLIAGYVFVPQINKFARFELDS
jgi:hypothetical protein